MVLPKLIQVSRILLFFFFLKGEFSTRPILASWCLTRGWLPPARLLCRASPPSNHKATGGLRAPALPSCRNGGTFPPRGRVSGGQEEAQTAILGWASLPLTHRVRSSGRELRSSWVKPQQRTHTHTQGQSLFLSSEANWSFSVLVKAKWGGGKDAERCASSPRTWDRSSVFVAPEPCTIWGPL